jgi:steroid 5-alpha reductase family enzyme
MNWLDVLATALTFAAISLQLLADLQLHRFIARRQEGEQLVRALWAWSR